MQRDFVNFTLGFLLFATICHTTSGRVASLLDVLGEKTKIDNYDVQPNQHLDSDSSFIVNDQPESVEQKKSPKKHLKKFALVELEGSHQGVTIEKGRSYELSCIVSSYPQATVHWVLPGENLDKAINELKKQSVASSFSPLDETKITRIHAKHVIDCATKKHEGNLYCVAVVGEKVHYNTTAITVDESSDNTHLCNLNREPIITYKVETAFALQGSKIELPCMAIGSPKPYIRWVDTMGNEIVNHVYNPRYEVLDDGTLVINDLVWKDMGGPTCIAESELGVDRAETFLYALAH